MKARAALFCAGLMLAAVGCGPGESVPEGTPDSYREEQESGNEEEVSAFYEAEEEKDAGDIPEDKAEEGSTDVPEKVVYTVLDVSGMVQSEAEIDPAQEDLWVPAPGGMSADTVEYVPLSEEEITETVYELSVVDETDPSTYEVVEYDQEVAVTRESPTEYSDSSGKVKYALTDGVWHEYSYSTGQVVLDSEDEELALLLLNIDGSYDGYELIEITCEPIEEEGNAAEYSYQVLYRMTTALEAAPTEVEHLTVTGTMQTRSTEVQTVQEKRPVTVSREEGTGEYLYYGWQQDSDGVCYYDKDGERITGSHVIRGIRYLFSPEGILTSHAGVDVSGRSGVIDWNRVRGAGMEYALIRAGYRGAGSGSLILDGEAERNLEGAAAAGMKTGVYIFSQAVTEREAVEEASLAVSLAERYGTALPVTMKLDYTGASYTGRADGLSPEDRTKIVRAFCETVRNAGYEPMVFAGENWMANSLDLPEGAAVCFAADGADHSSMEGCRMWQYTASGTLEGVPGYVGLSISCGLQQ